ncbi:MAG: hypothetical protein JJE21_08290 [Spirochaetaceae bacterium]|nr:hypothetical protein [Spirochaetaceae bacterium]
MNDAVYKFKRYEDSSLNYTGIDRHANEVIGGWDTIITKEDYESMFDLQQKSLGMPNFQSGLKKSVMIKPEKRKPQNVIVKKEVIAKKSEETTKKAQNAITQKASKNTPKTQHKNLDLGNLVGKTLNSKPYGVGKVIAQNGEVITVEFGKGKRKKETKYKIHPALDSGIINF